MLLFDMALKLYLFLRLLARYDMFLIIRALYTSSSNKVSAVQKKSMRGLQAKLRGLETIERLHTKHAFDSYSFCQRFIKQMDMFTKLVTCT